MGSAAILSCMMSAVGSTTTGCDGGMLELELEDIEVVVGSVLVDEDDVEVVCFVRGALY